MNKSTFFKDEFFPHRHIPETLLLTPERMIQHSSKRTMERQNKKFLIQAHRHSYLSINTKNQFKIELIK
ncbi:MAG: hypothetical protein ACLFUW_08525 [Bacteroidales bacterium]